MSGDGFGLVCMCGRKGESFIFAGACETTRKRTIAAERKIVDSHSSGSHVGLS